MVGRCKTEASQKPVPIDEYTAQDLLAWYRVTPYREPGDWVFASNSRRAGKNRGKQPLWLQTVMRYHIEPVVRELDIQKRVSWHTFRRTYTSLLHANGEDVKVVQELLRHGSAKVTLDVYARLRCRPSGGRSTRSSRWYGRKRARKHSKWRLNWSPNWSPTILRGFR